MATLRTEKERPRSIQQLFVKLRSRSQPQTWKKGLSFQPSPEDVLLTSGVKCGTAWMQQILHGLRSGGNMDFDDIDLVIPNLEFYYFYGKEDLNFSQPFAPPRIFKTHVSPQLTPKGFGKCICLTRDPKDAAVSLYHFFLNWLFEADEIALDELVEWLVIQDNDSEDPIANAYQLTHLISWFPHRKDDNVLWLHYEDLKEDLTYCIRLIAEFLDVGQHDPKLLKLVEEQAGFDFMKQHRSKFGLNVLNAPRNEYSGQPPDHGIENHVGRTHKGVVNEGVRLLSNEMNQKMDMKWKTFVEPVVGYSSYAEMRGAINAELGRTFGNNA